MKMSNANVVREAFGVEDVQRIATGAIAFPVVAEDGEEGWVEIDVKIPKWTEDDDGYAKAEEYRIHCAEMAEKAEAKAKEKAKKEAERKAKAEAKKSKAKGE